MRRRVQLRQIHFQICLCRLATREHSATFKSPLRLRSNCRIYISRTHNSITTKSIAMFFLYNLERQVTLHPSYFGKNMHELVTGKLLKDVEGTCTGRYFIITIMDTFNISEGRILPGSGLAEFTVGYRAVVWRPFKGETVRTWGFATTAQSL